MLVALLGSRLLKICVDYGGVYVVDVCFDLSVVYGVVVCIQCSLKIFHALWVVLGEYWSE